MKILLVTDAWTPQINGVVFTLQQTRRILTDMGHTVAVIHPGLFRSIPCPTYPEIRLSLGAGRRVAELIRNFAPDALHIATEGPLGMAARRHALRTGMPFTTAYHTRFPEYIQARIRLPLALTYRWLRWFHGPAARTMVPTRSVRADLLAYGFDPARVIVWSRGVDLDTFRPGPADPEASPAQPPTRPVFLYAGRTAVEKNLDAFLSLSLPGEKWVVGDGPVLVSLKARYPDVRFLGALPHTELAHCYRMADVFVFPSLTDTFGLVLLEAMACGCPVAALPASATLDVLGDSGAGIIDADLQAACLQALEIDRSIPTAYARGFSWEQTTCVFFEALQPIEAQ
ncbi:MAG: glycosyltransferase family 1 protein [Corticimicrobacter sp.]|uniref:glycosyltransferase family 4 protein n=1 Tax=Corticimicrobacter sp. TaxID=2678536 RepID=UPI0032DB401E